jgi:hypothetical protein
MDMISKFGVLFVVLGGLGFLSADRHQRRQELRVIGARDELDDEAIYRSFYESSGLPQDSIRDVWHEIAESLRLPAGKIRPMDRFGKDVGRYLITSDDLDALHQRGRQRAKQLGLDLKFETLMTVDDYVRALAIARGE